MAEGTPTQPRALQTSRPWLTVAGCLGGSVLSIALLVIALAIVAVWAFFPEWLPFGAGVQDR
ncbi:MAG: hypothetical protein RL354_65 [Planctomycetota bacterium]|jgi:hypothetical protein